MRPRVMFPVVLMVAAVLSSPAGVEHPEAKAKGLASWYGEAHRGKLMANGCQFNPDRLTAASWFYPLGTKVEVKLARGDKVERRVVVTITDRGPAHRLVEQGRIIDLSRAAFRKLAALETGLVRVSVQPVGTSRTEASADADSTSG